jgi:hypothetical protein
VSDEILKHVRSVTRSPRVPKCQASPESGKRPAERARCMECGRGSCLLCVAESGPQGALAAPCLPPSIGCEQVQPRELCGVLRERVVHCTFLGENGGQYQ